MSISQAIARLSCNPARILRTDRGTLSIDVKADVTLIDAEKVAQVDVKKFKSKSRNTPFNGWELQGWPVMTITNGVVEEKLRRTD